MQQVLAASTGIDGQQGSGRHALLRSVRPRDRLPGRGIATETAEIVKRLSRCSGMSAMRSPSSIRLPDYVIEFLR